MTNHDFSQQNFSIKLYIAATGRSYRVDTQQHLKSHTQNTHTHSFVPWKPMGAPSDISEYCRTSETSPGPLSPYCTSSISDKPFHLLSSSLSCSSLNRLLFLFPPSACLYPFPLNPFPFPLPSTFSPFIFFLSSSTSPLSSLALSSLASVLGASRIFPWFRFSFLSSIALLSPLPRCSLQPDLLLAL